MKLAFTGTSCTGKTTLAKYLMDIPEFVSHVEEFITTDARTLLDGMGFKSMDNMTLAQLRAFQKQYYHTKAEQERGRQSFLTDRSFIDVAAYWVCRDNLGGPREVHRQLELPCREASRKYDAHFYFPEGIIPFEQDGYRSCSQELHRLIDRQISKYLKEWNISFIPLAMVSLADRANTVLTHIRRLSS